MVSATGPRRRAAATCGAHIAASIAPLLAGTWCSAQDDGSAASSSPESMTATEGSRGPEGRWASGPSPDGKGTFTTEPIAPLADDDGMLGPVDPRTYGTPQKPVPPAAA